MTIDPTTLMAYKRKHGFDKLKKNHTITNAGEFTPDPSVWDDFTEVISNYYDIMDITRELKKRFVFHRILKPKKTVPTMDNELFRKIEQLYHERKFPHSPYNPKVYKGKPSNVLNAMTERLVDMCVPEEYREGGRKSTQGVFHGVNKQTGKAILSRNPGASGTPDVWYSFIIPGLPDWATEGKIKDKHGDKQKKYQTIIRSNGGMCEVSHSITESVNHWQTFCTLYRGKFPKGCILVINNEIVLT